MSTVREELERELEQLLEPELRQVAEFARFLQWARERREWIEAGETWLAEAYGEDEPEYTLADIRETNP